MRGEKKMESFLHFNHVIKEAIQDMLKKTSFFSLVFNPLISKETLKWEFHCVFWIRRVTNANI